MIARVREKFTSEGETEAAIGAGDEGNLILGLHHAFLSVLRVPRCQKILKADISEQLSSYPIGNAVDDLAAILRRIDVNPKRPPAKWGLDDLNDRFRDPADVGVSGLKRLASAREARAPKPLDAPVTTI